MPKLKPTCPRKTKKQLKSVQGVSPVGGKVIELWRKGSVERWVLSLDWKKEGVMDGDRDDEGNDELTCVRLDKSDKSSWSAGRPSSLAVIPLIRCWAGDKWVSDLWDWLVADGQHVTGACNHVFAGDRCGNVWRSARCDLYGAQHAHCQTPLVHHQPRPSFHD